MKEFPNEFYYDPNQKRLLWATCDKSIDTLSGSTVVHYTKIIKHIEKKAWKDKVAQLELNGESALKLLVKIKFRNFTFSINIFSKYFQFL